MFFTASKILGFFALPSNLVITFGILGALLLRTRYARAGWRLVVLSLVLLAIIGFSHRQRHDGQARTALPGLGHFTRAAGRHRRARRRAQSRDFRRPQCAGAQ
jgi:hypothetical protein